MPRSFHENILAVTCEPFCNKACNAKRENNDAESTLSLYIDNFMECRSVSFDV